MNIIIKNRWTEAIIFQAEAESLKAALEIAIKQNVSLRAANLSAANLSAANLRDADLSAADLSDANLSAADLRDADLSAANLSDANLRAADLRAANLRDANLSAADLRAANLRDAKQPVLSIFASRHQIIAIGDDVRIGCYRRSISEWLAEYARIGKENNYSAAQIEEYHLHLLHLQTWLALKMQSAQGQEPAKTETEEVSQ